MRAAKATKDIDVASVSKAPERAEGELRATLPQRHGVEILGINGRIDETASEPKALGRIGVAQVDRRIRPIIVRPMPLHQRRIDLGEASHDQAG